ncbi:LLM class flavin-dependent oxidoreductase [Rhodococcus wratislaviensis]|uniref:LLM class flavin-dependent oxidoreductase n=1 Tax=Rhodococcus wratislaviensis TaxID=44752 RepID=UPI003657D475
MTDRRAAISISASAGRRRSVLDLVGQVEDRGLDVYSTFHGDVMGFCTSLCHLTSSISFGSCIQPIYARPAAELARSASYIAELSEGRFRLGLGVSQPPILKQLGVKAGKPIGDMRAYVSELKSAIGGAACPPIILAALRTKMLTLATEIADGAVSANAARSHMPKTLASVARPDGFTMATMIPTVVDADKDAARAVHRRTLTRYLTFATYRAYWKEAGYADEMFAVESALAAGNTDSLQSLMTDAWLDDCTLSGSPEEIREGVDAWFATGVDLPILAPSSTSGGQAKAVIELLAVFD